MCLRAKLLYPALRSISGQSRPIRAIHHLGQEQGPETLFTCRRHFIHPPTPHHPPNATSYPLPPSPTRRLSLRCGDSGERDPGRICIPVTANGEGKLVFIRGNTSLSLQICNRVPFERSNRAIEDFWDIYVELNIKSHMHTHTHTHTRTYIYYTHTHTHTCIQTQWVTMLAKDAVSRYTHIHTHTHTVFIQTHSTHNQNTQTQHPPTQSEVV